jgi:formylglycine-generating enzyme required for sulfatase activity
MKLVKTLIAIAAIGVGSQAFGGISDIPLLNPTLELEPNNDTSSANKVQTGEIYGGYISPSTVDYYSFATIGGDGNYTFIGFDENMLFTIINQGGETLYQFAIGTLESSVLLTRTLRLASGSYYVVVTCEEGVGNEYVFKLDFRDSFSGWNYHAWPWVYNDADKGWLYYYCGSNGWAVWRHKDKKWYSFDEASKAWIVVPGQEDVQEEQDPAANKAGDTFTIPDLSLEMIWVEPGTFTMGSPESEPGRSLDETQHEVTLTNGFWLGKYEVTQAQWQKVMGDTPSFFKGASRPVEYVTWTDVTSFCEKLTEQESEAGRLPAGMAYQLPTEAQWEYACRAGTKTAFSFGEASGELHRHANYADVNTDYDSSDKAHDDGYENTSPVGSYKANAWGFHDMHGNVFEWCADCGGAYPNGAVSDPAGSADDFTRVFRGGSWIDSAYGARSAMRTWLVPAYSNAILGFRLSLRPAGEAEPQEEQQVPTANNAGDTYTVPDLSLKMIWVEPGTFTMGSPTTEAYRYSLETQHEVTLTNGFWLGKHEVTQAQWEKVMGGNPSGFKGADRPVEQVTWADVTSFCEKLTELERKASRLPAGMAYQLPTEAQWEYACRAGTTTAYSWGSSIAISNANYPTSEIRDVGQYAGNPWGFHDMHGNVWEWCADWYGDYPSGPARDPVGPTVGSNRVFRGGSTRNEPFGIRSAHRVRSEPARSSSYLGFRLSLRPASK